MKVNNLLEKFISVNEDTRVTIYRIENTSIEELCNYSTSLLFSYYGKEELNEMEVMYFDYSAKNNHLSIRIY